MNVQGEGTQVAGRLDEAHGIKPVRASLLQRSLHESPSDAAL
jgi:hypothetical protein